MFSKLFGSKKNEPQVTKPSILGLTVGTSFDVDTFGFKLVMDKLTITDMAKTQIIKAAGKAEMDGNTVYRFYTDDEAWLQVVCEGGDTEDDIIDVKLFHYYDTKSVDSDYNWDALLNREIGAETQELEGNTFSRVWNSTGDYAMPVHIREVTYDETEQPDTTDQFAMLFEREVDNDHVEVLFLSAEEVENEQGHLEHCLVISTGLNLSPAQITIHG